MRLYQALTFKAENGVFAQEGPPLCGFKCGNRYQPGCLTDDASVRLHSCEKGTSCDVIESSPVVWITPIIIRASNGLNVPELGAGGGGGDLLQSHELDLSDTAAAFELVKLCSEKIADAQARSRTLSLISEAFTSSSKILCLDASELDEDLEDMPLEDIADLLERIANRRSREGGGRPKYSRERIETADTVGEYNTLLAQSLPNYIVRLSFHHRTIVRNTYWARLSHIRATHLTMSCATWLRSSNPWTSILVPSTKMVGMRMLVWTHCLVTFALRKSLLMTMR